MKLGNYEVRWTHYKNKQGKLNRTQCSVTKDDVIQGVGSCKKYVDDNWDRKIGRKKSMERALQTSLLTKDERAAIWTDYWSVGNRK